MHGLQSWFTWHGKSVLGCLNLISLRALTELSVRCLCNESQVFMARKLSQWVYSAITSTDHSRYRDKRK